MFGDATMMSSGQCTLTYAQFARETQVVLQALHAAGVEPNELIHIKVSNRPLDLAALLGVSQVGARLVQVQSI